MSNDVIKQIAYAVPTTIDELRTLAVLGEQKVADYGDKVVSAINRFLEVEGLAEFVQSKRPTKRAKTSAATVASSKQKTQDVIMLDGDDGEFDEFDDGGIDFNAIDCP